jgi:hypothetical protein
MKTLLFLFATSFLFCSSSMAQNDYSKVIVNGQENHFSFSRSEKNTIVVVGTCCDEFRLDARGVTLTKEKEGYLVVLPEGDVTPVISVSGYIEGKWWKLYDVVFKIED